MSIDSDRQELFFKLVLLSIPAALVKAGIIDPSANITLENMPLKITKPTKKSSRSYSTKTNKDTLKDKIESDSNQLIKPIPKKPAEFPKDPKNNNVRYWLIKSEPLTRIDPKTGKDVKFPLSELQKVEFETWDGVRNHEAKNNMLNMAKGDYLLFYHSNTSNPGIVGLAKVHNEAHPDPTQFDPKSNYYDAKSTKEAPRWWCVDVAFLRRFRSKVTLEELRSNPKLQEMSLVKRGRLSVTPVRLEEYYEVLAMEKEKPLDDDIDCDIDRKFVEIE
ncbi:Thymocyte nuclear protein 1 [Wickerhamomyces ciferrii]|uniref:Thymocyte nuclear protein 1 n=1 Tax=Wickerhamomyces ciferrii (strain ATCC 14091 / BCRC 22168 / CBS 111 / JCM 3599 / NBRC 0793 / NRRL Y-1031 F-60-10) TaxID=1206466 RepID=K0KI03_WICCF|nr:Thymocyte nuclear protein 1 [Wickerhamomyces ciferrii]CCH44835.1 Thymocyte nuclear protein 1 [Wickerhamomyces ciferrii]